MSSPSRRCIRCQAELPKDSGYCLSCGCQNDDVVVKKATAEFARSEQLDQLRARVSMQQRFGWLFRFFR